MFKYLSWWRSFFILHTTHRELYTRQVTAVHFSRVIHDLLYDHTAFVYSLQPLSLLSINLLADGFESDSGKETLPHHNLRLHLLHIVMVVHNQHAL